MSILLPLFNQEKDSKTEHPYPKMHCTLQQTINIKSKTKKGREAETF